MIPENIYVKAHKKISVEVTDSNLETVLKDKETMLKLCTTKYGNHTAAYAIAHSQINDKKPLRFFVTYKGEIIVNPRITRHTNTELTKKEGCMTFPDKEQTEVKRWNKIEAEYQVLEDDQLSELKTIKLSGIWAEVWQHEIDHMNGKYIYGNSIN